METQRKPHHTGGDLGPSKQQDNELAAPANTEGPPTACRDTGLITHTANRRRKRRQRKSHHTKARARPVKSENVSESNHTSCVDQHKESNKKNVSTQNYEPRTE